MKKSTLSHEPVETMGEAYEMLLDKAVKKAHQSGAVVHHVIDEVKDEVAALHKLTNDEVVSLKESVNRDLAEAARYLEETDKELDFWLGFDVSLIKLEFWKLFSEAADQTTASLYQLKRQAGIAGYHTGEIIGLGTLVCDQCGEKLHYRRPGHIPPCPKCNSTAFHRQYSE